MYTADSAADNTAADSAAVNTAADSAAVLVQEV